jgi:hypothetical protein
MQILPQKMRSLAALFGPGNSTQSHARASNVFWFLLRFAGSRRPARRSGGLPYASHQVFDYAQKNALVLRGPDDFRFLIAGRVLE